MSPRGMEMAARGSRVRLLLTSRHCQGVLLHIGRTKIIGERPAEEPSRPKEQRTHAWTSARRQRPTQRKNGTAASSAATQNVMVAGSETS